MANIVPPVFGAIHDSIFDESELDLDFKLLSDCLFDDGQMQQLPPLTKEGGRSKRGGTPKVSTVTRGKRGAKAAHTSAPSLRRSESNESMGGVSDEDAEDFSDDEEPIQEVSSVKNRHRVDKRRERNRVLARKTRLRKKFFFESLQRQVAQLSKENEMLKNIASTHLKPDVLQEILSSCCSELPPCVVTSAQHANSILEKADFKLMTAIQSAQRSFCITDPSLPDNPIVFASQGFLDLTRYSMDQVLGRNCRFLQGPRTDPDQIGLIRQGLIEGKDVNVRVINYRADGTEFFNQLFIAGLRDANGRLVNYVGVLAELQKRTESEEAMCDESLTRPAKKGRPRLKDKEEKVSANKGPSAVAKFAPGQIVDSERLSIGLDIDNMYAPQQHRMKTEGDGAIADMTFGAVPGFGDEKQQ